MLCMKLRNEEDFEGFLMHKWLMSYLLSKIFFSESITCDICDTLKMVTIS